MTDRDDCDEPLDDFDLKYVGLLAVIASAAVTLIVIGVALF